MNNKLLSSTLLHCFGAEKSTEVTPEMAANMIKASGIKEIPINTHNIDDVTNWHDLPIGYGKTSWTTLSDYMDLNGYKPLWNINLPQNAKEAVSRTEKVVRLGGEYPVKFEILDAALTWSNNSDVLTAVNYLVNTNYFEVWPLIAPDYNVFTQLQEWNCQIIRIMGSRISSNMGMLPEYVPIIEKILENKKYYLMLDGGVGSLETVKQAMNLGFDHILVNSWLFNDGVSTVDLLKNIRSITE